MAMVLLQFYIQGFQMWRFILKMQGFLAAEIRKMGYYSTNSTIINFKIDSILF